MAAMETKLKEEKEKVLRLERELIIVRGPKSKSRLGTGTGVIQICLIHLVVNKYLAD